MGLLSWLRRKPAPAKVVSPEQLLADEVAGVVRSSGSFAEVEYLPEKSAIRARRHGKGPEGAQYVYLQNLLAETREMSPEDRAARIQFFLEGMLNAPDMGDWSVVEPRLLPILKPCTFGFLRTDAGKLETYGISRPFAPFVDERVVVDFPQSMGYVGPVQLKKWGVGEDEVFAAASANYARLTLPPLEVYGEAHGRILHAPGDDEYAISRLLRPGWLASLRDQVEGNPIAIMPERSILFVGGDAQRETVKWLAEAAQREYRAASRSISPAVYTADAQGRVVPYPCAGSDEAALLVRRGHQLLRGHEYANQKAVLDQHHEATGIDVFVASATVVGLEDGRTITYAVWTEGVEALLPCVDAIVANGVGSLGSQKWTACVPFEVAREIAGESWTRAEVPGGPRRIRASGRISGEQKAALLEAAVELGAIPDAEP